MLTFVHIGKDNRAAFGTLRVSAAQAPLIEPNASWIADALGLPECETRGICWHDTPVGLFSLVDPRKIPDDPDTFQPGCVFLWRLMIDHRHQRNGLGSLALERIFQSATARGFEGVSLTVVDTEPSNVLPFYRKCGFTPTGRRIDGEVELVRRLP